MTLREWLDIVATLVIAGAAVVMVGFYVHDRMSLAAPAETYADDWEQWRESGVRIGTEDPSMVVAVFMDFTCPFCRRLVPVLDSVLVAYPEDAAVEFHHFPLEGREGALEAAVAAECALRQDRFPEMYRALYAAGDSIGVKGWDAIAEEAGVPDTAQFQVCVGRSADEFERIEASRELGARLGVRGTPTIWVNGWLFDRGRSVAALREKADELGIGS